MAFIDTFVDRIFYDGTRNYTVRSGNVDYLDGNCLRRPFTMPAAQRVIMVIFVIAAIVIGYFFIDRTVLASYREAASTQQAIESNLARPGAMKDLPDMASLITLDNDEIRSKFEEDGYIIYDATSDDEDDDELILYRIPSDMTLEEAAPLFDSGIAFLDPTHASKLLNGAWFFSASRMNVTSMVVRYVDFTTADPQAAVRNAISNQGFDLDSITDTGVDDSGNTYSSGTLEIDDSTYTWKVSALPLSDMYSITGLPEDACYVGIRITAA